MKTIYFLIGLLVALSLCELIAYKIDQGYPPFLNSPFPPAEFGGFVRRLYKNFDPNLGYTFNRNFRPSRTDLQTGKYFSDYDAVERKKEGFITLSYQSADIKNSGLKPINIVVLGHETTDPNLYSGNWPWQLHLRLKELNVTHKIWNGGVAGYGTYQELMKLTRDVFYLNAPIDFVIAYDGQRDVPYPDTPPKKFNYSEGQNVATQEILDEDFPPIIFPNIQFVYKRLRNHFLRSSERRLSLGSGQDSPESAYFNNVVFMKSICDSKKVSFIHMIEPLARNKEQLEITVQLGTKFEPKADKAVAEFFNNVADRLRTVPYSYSLESEFAYRAAVFLPVDESVPNIAGQKIVAQRALEIMKANKPDRLPDVASAPSP